MAKDTIKKPHLPKGKDSPTRTDGPAKGAQGNPASGGKIFGRKWESRTIRQVRSA